MSLNKTFKFYKRILLFLLLIFSFDIFLDFDKTNLCDSNSTLLKNKILGLSPSSSPIMLNDLTEFELDKVYSFSPYTTKKDIYETIGLNFNIAKTVSEGMNHMMFLNRDEVVCYLYGYPDETKYYISLDCSFYENGIGVAHFDDNILFDVSTSDSILTLTHIID
ncbi:hypothetical protein K4H40_10395 [Clostridium chauvoei]|uniref:hypothetical protein n=1 Tax=Clostridium chauvoei TaxID=46867 RepID=UPI001C860531|nr:hypothetical protein [Clostridium chauvoei]MBX7389666.1 hypothetical protein [Clostridium chauvoei]